MLSKNSFSTNLSRSREELDKEESVKLSSIHLRSMLPGLFLLSRNHTPVRAIAPSQPLLGAIGGKTHLFRGVHTAVLVYVVDHGCPHEDLPTCRERIGSNSRKYIGLFLICVFPICIRVRSDRFRNRYISEIKPYHSSITTRLCVF